MTALAGICLGASYPELQGLLNPGSFVDMETEALKSNTMIFFLPLAAVLPWSDSFVRERQGGFLKTALPRIGRCYYVESKVFTTALGGFLSVTSGTIWVQGKNIGKEVDLPESLGAIIESPGRFCELFRVIKNKVKKR